MAMLISLLLTSNKNSDNLNTELSHMEFRYVWL